MPPSPNSSDGKDLLEQLLTIHFSLAVICLTTVIVVNLPESTKFSRAADDLDKVVKIAQSPSWEKQLVVEAAKSVARGHKECQPVDAPSEGRPAAANFATTSPLGPLRIEIDRMWDLDFADLPVTLDDTLLPVLTAP